jgi:hypothetical protein
MTVNQLENEMTNLEFVRWVIYHARKVQKEQIR